MELYDKYGDINYIILNNKRYFLVIKHDVENCFSMLFSEEFLDEVFDIRKVRDIEDISEEMDNMIYDIARDKFDDRIMSLNNWDIIMY